MSIPSSDDGSNQSKAAVSNDAEPACKILDALPYELVEMVVSHVANIQDLRSLALTNKLFQTLAEPYIYANVFIRKGDQALNLFNAIQSKPIRATWIRNLQNACLAEYPHGLLDLADLVPRMTRLENLIVETPDCNAFSPEMRVPWIQQQDLYTHIFDQASQPNAKPLLPRLTSCTLHYVDRSRSLYHLGRHSIIFLHPTLTELTISCAHIDPPHKLHPLLSSSSLTNTTSLKTLRLIECDFHNQGLYHLLRLPQQLNSLAITEANHYTNYTTDRRYPGLKTTQTLTPISTSQPHLQHLQIARTVPTHGSANFRRPLFSLLPLDLSRFPLLHTVHYVDIAGPRPPSTSAQPLQIGNYCDVVHAMGPQGSTGGPSTTTLIYSDIPTEWMERGTEFFTCAFRNKVSHGIESLQCLKLVLRDDELLISRYRDAVRVPDRGETRQQGIWRERVERVRALVRQLGKVGREEKVGIRVIVEWIRPNGGTIPPYLTGEYVPVIRKEYDNGVGLDGGDVEEAAEKADAEKTAAEVGASPAES